MNELAKPIHRSVHRTCDCATIGSLIKTLNPFMLAIHREPIILKHHGRSTLRRPGLSGEQIAGPQRSGEKARLVPPQSPSVPSTRPNPSGVGCRGPIRPPHPQLKACAVKQPCFPRRAPSAGRPFIGDEFLAARASDSRLFPAILASFFSPGRVPDLSPDLWKSAAHASSYGRDTLPRVRGD